MASYQDLDTRVRVMEDKIDFIMKTITLQGQIPSRLVGGEPQTVKRTMLELYRDVKTAGIELIERSGVGDGERN